MGEYKILGPKDTGRGILIEYDAGYINPKEGRNYEILKESSNHLDHSKPFEFYAVLQKYNTPNRNGRLYPEKILKREAENFNSCLTAGSTFVEAKGLLLRLSTSTYFPKGRFRGSVKLPL